MLRKKFGPKRHEVRGEWRRLHNMEVYALYAAPNAIRVIKSRMQMGRTCSTYGERKGGKPEGRRPLGRPTRTWEDNIKMDLFEKWDGDMDWVDLAQNRDRLWARMNEPSGSIKCGEFVE